MKLPSPPTVDLLGGSVRGEHVGGARVFRNIPYAAAPTGELRFAAPRPHPGWKGIRNCEEPGPAVPQADSRLAGVMGSAPRLQDESESLTVSVFAPTDPGPHPVLFWIHGGGFSSGSGGWPWYDGSRLAVGQRVIVVTLNYRLGAAGFLNLAETCDDMGAGNFGVLDQVLALQWVYANIGAFGGDPERILVGGQSAGALSAAALVSNPQTRRLVRGAVLQSPPASTMIQPAPIAHDRARMLLKQLDVPPAQCARRLRALPAQALVEATVELARDVYRFGDFDPVFAPTEDRDLGLVSALGGPLLEGAADDLPILIGSTGCESAAFLCQHPRYADLGEDDVRAWFDDVLGDAGPSSMATFVDAYPHLGWPERLVAASTCRSFTSEVLSIAESRSFRGAPTWVYQFIWSPAGSAFGACHCIDLPFLFGTFESFADAPMLSGSAKPSHIHDAFQSAVGALVRDGEPRCSELPAWQEYQHDCDVQLLGDEIAIDSRPVSEVERLWM